MTSIVQAKFVKSTFVAAAMALTVVGGIAATPGTADARGFGGGGFRGGGFHGGFGGRGFAGRGFGYRGGFGRGFGGRFGYGYGRGFGWRGGYGWRRGFGWRGGYGFYGVYPGWGYRCGPWRRAYGLCRYYW